MSVLLASFIFPKSASHQASDNLALALEGLCRLSQLAWSSANLSLPGEEALHNEGCYVQLDGSAVEGTGGGDMLAREAECEKVLYLKMLGFHYEGDIILSQKCLEGSSFQGAHARPSKGLLTCWTKYQVFNWSAFGLLMYLGTLQ